MGKLVSKFEDIYFEYVMYKDDEAFKSVKIYAEETKKIAIEFAKYRTEYIYADTQALIEKDFDKFIEEYYE